MRTLLLSLTQTRTNSAVAYGDFFGEIVTEWKKAPNLAQSFFLVQGTNLERVPPETTTGGGKREMGFNLPLHISAWKRGWMSRRSFSCFVLRLKIKKIYTEKKIVRVSLLLFALFSMLNITAGENVFLEQWVLRYQCTDATTRKPTTRIAVHVLHALHKGHSQVLIRTVDTDILVIMIGLFN